jgi:hypothetical protein
VVSVLNKVCFSSFLVETLFTQIFCHHKGSLSFGKRLQCGIIMYWNLFSALPCGAIGYRQTSGKIYLIYVWQTWYNANKA